VPGGVVQVAPDGSILTANAEARRMLGLTADDLSRRALDIKRQVQKKLKAS